MPVKYTEDVIDSIRPRQGKITETHSSELKNKCKKAIRDAFVAIDEIRAKNKHK